MHDRADRVTPPRVTDPDAWWAQFEKDYDGRTWRDYRALLGEFLFWAEGPPLVDVGCGLGFLVECARRFGIEAVGLEASETAVEKSHQMHPEADVRLWHGGEALPFDDASVGGAVLNQFVDHITLEENRFLFQELLRVLKPGGVVIVKSPSRFNRFDQDPGHVTFFSPSEFRDFVEKSSLEVVKQAFVPQPLMGQSGLGRFVMRQMVRICRREKWAATIDLVARKKGDGLMEKKESFGAGAAAGIG